MSIFAIIASAAVLAATLNMVFGWIGGKIAQAFSILAVAMMAFSSYNYVPADHAGIVLSSGEPNRYVRSGSAFTLPWETVASLPLGNQPLRFTKATSPGLTSTDDDDDVPTQDCVKVSIDGYDGCFEAAVHWQILDDPALEQRLTRLWIDYGSAENISQQLVLPETEQAIRTATSARPPAEAFGSTAHAAIVQAITDRLQQRLALHGIVLTSFTLGDSNLSGSQKYDLYKV